MPALPPRRPEKRAESCDIGSGGAELFGGYPSFAGYPGSSGAGAAGAPAPGWGSVSPRGGAFGRVASRLPQPRMRAFEERLKMALFLPGQGFAHAERDANIARRNRWD